MDRFLPCFISYAQFHYRSIVLKIRTEISMDITGHNWYKHHVIYIKKRIIFVFVLASAKFFQKVFHCLKLSQEIFLIIFKVDLIEN